MLKAQTYTEGYTVYVLKARNAEYNYIADTSIFLRSILSQCNLAHVAV